MKVLFFSDSEPSSSSLEYCCGQIARELNKQSIEASVYASWNRRVLPSSIPIPDIKSYLPVLGKQDVLVLHRHGNPLALLAVAIAKARGTRVIYSLDDSLFAHEASRHKILHTLWYSALPQIMLACDTVIVGSHYLAEYARRHNDDVRLIPSAIDTSIFYPRPQEQTTSKFVIGWMGLGTYHVDNLKLLVEPLATLSSTIPIKLKLVSSLGSREIHRMFEHIHTLEVDYGLPYQVPLASVAEQMAEFDISVAPLQDSPFSRGRCASKALCSMAMGIPVVASAIGEHNHIITEGSNGFLAHNTQEWIEKLSLLIESEQLRSRIGQAGLKSMQSYTLTACVQAWRNLLDGN